MIEPPLSVSTMTSAEATGKSGGETARWTCWRLEADISVSAACVSGAHERSRAATRRMIYVVNNRRSRAIKLSWWQTGVYVTSESRRQKHLQNVPDAPRHQNLLRFRPSAATRPQTHLITCCRSLWRETWGSSHVCVDGSSDGPLCGIAVESRCVFFQRRDDNKKRMSN